MEQNEKQIIDGGFQFPPNMFVPKKVDAKEEEPISEIPQPDEIIDAVFNTAIVETVKNDDEVKEEIVVSAKDAILNKTKAIKDQTEAEAKEAHFNNHKGACECFGFTEKSTEKWAVTMMSFWHRVMTAIWIVIGFVTYAPISFIAAKLGVIIKRTWLAVVVSGLIYVVVALSPLWISILKKLGGGA